MKSYKRRKFIQFILLIGFLLCAVNKSHSQDIHFSLYNDAPLLLNPALAGSSNSPFRATLSYRNQWASVGNAYQTFAGSFELPLLVNRKNSIPKPYIGLGLGFYKDAAGDARFGVSNVSLTGSAQVPLAEQHKVAAGFQVGFAQQSASTGALQWGNQYNGVAFDPTISSGEANRLASDMYTDLAYGLHYQFTNINENFISDGLIKAYAGYAVYHVNKPEQVYFGESTQSVYKKQVLTLGGSFDISNTKIAVLPSFLFLKQGPSSEKIFGAMVQYKLAEGTKFTGFNIQKSVGFGLQYRTGDAVIPQIMYQVAGWQFGFSYDMNISSLSEASNTIGAFELSAKYTAPRKNKFKKR